MALFQQTTEKALKEMHEESQQPQEPAHPQ
jgi:hypothetical protein